MDKVREVEKSGTVEVKGGKRFNTSSFMFQKVHDNSEKQSMDLVVMRPLVSSGRSVFVDCGG